MTSDETEWADLDAAERDYTRHQMAADAAKERLFDASAAMVQKGRSPEAVAARIKANKQPEEVDAAPSFTAAYIRRQVRDRGVAPLRSGPKKR